MIQQQFLAQPVKINKKGFTLIEAMFAILIMSFIMLGTMTWMISIYRTSTDNMTREEAIKVTQETMEKIRNRRFDSLSTGTNSTNIVRYIQKTPYQFAVTRTITTQVPDIARKLTVNVRWDKNFDGDSIDPEDGNFTSITIIGNKDED